ncbi:MAG: alpha/beta fold hydrolase [Deltaproteobacteria bacterium]|nr:alpha/beta fold hydrolase [Candidatus Zymogenaceae bacterium]
MRIIRTPEGRFDNLPDFPFTPRFVEVGGLTVHYVDEGSGQPILLLHGEPTWSFLYRKMIGPLARSHRVLAPDFVGFGKSDKPADPSDYSFGMHTGTLKGFVEKLDLVDITLVVHDWGGMIGLSFAAQNPRLIKRLVILNTGLPTGRKTSPAFMQWREFVANTPDLPIDVVIRMGLAKPDGVTDEVIAGYTAPFPDGSFKAGARAWPLMVPIAPDSPVALENSRTRDALSRWEKPALVLFSDKDPISKGADGFFRELIPTAKDQPPVTISDAGHFLQEEKPEEIARHIIEFIERTRG